MNLPQLRDAARRRLRLIRAVILALGLTVGVGALAIWFGRGEERALRRMPADERATLYRRTLDNLVTVCADSGAAGLSEFCREQAEFILKFPECDDTCRAMARRHLLRPTR